MQPNPNGELAIQNPVLPVSGAIAWGMNAPERGISNPQLEFSTPRRAHWIDDGRRRWRRNRYVQLLCMYGDARRVNVRFSYLFIASALSVALSAVALICYFFLQVNPKLNEEEGSGCNWNDSQLAYNAKVLLLYFLWFAVTRLALFIPCILARVAAIQTRTHGFCRTYCVHLLIRDGPLYIFVVGSLLFWFNFARVPNCGDVNSPLFEVLRIFSSFACGLSLLCIMVVYWHNKLITLALDATYGLEPNRGAPPETLQQLETVFFDPDMFGDEDGKTYPAECSICLGSWEMADVIKVTPCSHAFHEECIGSWLKNARTCAICRMDLTCQADNPQLSAQTIGANNDNPVFEANPSNEFNEV